ncbi:hypothetical protein GCM10011351_15380 [Paraliobacillus quinghaiensis]|uniref:YtxH domain-containing protein n=1 Tax=Paraliobacillus quinghaiensis TaxID=470815 RepID=A0A917WTB0_9BACI|nr:hypothetical protein [Paraliobacillus quinghaiensis]GGM30164.1 hypothetical protein GCM10011351_15380 [Paraliobacillus quinghaiensis]
MGKGLMYKGIFLGAVIGGALTLLDHDTRRGAKLLVNKTKVKANFYKNHPAIFAADLRNQYEHLSASLLSGMNSTIQMLASIEGLIEQVEDKRRIE